MTRAFSANLCAPRATSAYNQQSSPGLVARTSKFAKKRANEAGRAQAEKTRGVQRFAEKARATAKNSVYAQQVGANPRFKGGGETLGETLNRFEPAGLLHSPKIRGTVKIVFWPKNFNIDILNSFRVRRNFQFSFWPLRSSNKKIVDLNISKIGHKSADVRTN